MRKLIIVGNGFDLAHNRKTSYMDFLLWHFRESFKELTSYPQTHDDPLIKVSVINPLLPAEIDRMTNPDDFKRYIVDKRGILEFPDAYHNSQRYNLLFRSLFAREIFDNCCDYRWVDIENIFYKHLKNKTISTGITIKDRVNQLNVELEFLKSRLKGYLSTIEPAKPIARYSEILQAPMNFKHVKNITAKHTLLLNFNYTDTARLYSVSNMKIINIHGQWDNDDNPMIFGYGDELDDNYREFRLNESINYVEHLKSFHYPFTDNYIQLERFLGYSPHDTEVQFEAVLLGHSCGRSDKTMLNFIFEHPNCRSIKLYYYKKKDGTDDFRQISNNVARQCDSTRWYSKMLPKKYCSQMPQFDDAS